MANRITAQTQLEEGLTSQQLMDLNSGSIVRLRGYDTYYIKSSSDKFVNLNDGKSISASVMTPGSNYVVDYTITITPVK